MPRTSRCNVADARLATLAAQDTDSRMSVPAPPWHRAASWPCARLATNEIRAGRRSRHRRALGQPLEQRAMDAAETSVAHHQDAIAVRAYARTSSTRAVSSVVRAWRALRAGRALPATFQPTPAPAIAEHAIGAQQARRQFRLHCALLHRVGPRLEHRNDARVRRSGCAAPQCVSRIAVGWCAKSSMTVTPSTVPRTSSRRLTPPKRASASSATRGSTPT